MSDCRGYAMPITVFPRKLVSGAQDQEARCIADIAKRASIQAK